VVVVGGMVVVVEVEVVVVAWVVVVETSAVVDSTALPPPQAETIRASATVRRVTRFNFLPQMCRVLTICNLT
jgi:hypothetical protein